MSEGRKRATWVLLGLVASLVAIVVGFFSLAWALRSTGTSCRVDRDCNSHMCLLASFSSEGVCTEICHADGDCPDDMRCATGWREGPGSFSGASRERHICVPD